MSVEVLLIGIFIIGYLLIVFEHNFRIDKAGPALLTGILMWTAHIITAEDYHVVNHHFLKHLADISSILFFLLGAMTIVEIIDMHDGFHTIINRIKESNKRKLLWIVCILTFFLSAILDNLTTTIVMVSLLNKMIDSKKDRLLFVGMIVISANAGGAWSPIGDITTTMLWIGGQITVLPTIKAVFLPSLVCMIIPLIITSFALSGHFERVTVKTKYKTTRQERGLILFTGIGLLLFVPVFKTITHLPPFMGMFFGVGVLWLMTDFLHVKKGIEEKSEYSVLKALSKIDSTSILFFFGILAAITALESYGTLEKLAEALNHSIGNLNIIVIIIGILSAIVDNVPLVAAAMGMYGLEQYPTDSTLWQFIAYCAGTGGSILIIGSAAGVAAMGLERINFIWYLKRIGPLALLGYLAGAGVYLLLN